MIRNTLASAYSHVRNSSPRSIQTHLPSTENPTKKHPTPTCECPSCHTITELSITYINLGESKQTTCTNCDRRFTVTFTENKSWEFHTLEESRGE